MAKVGDDPKLRSALATTRGGAMRDLYRLEEAKSLAMEAHKLTPADFRPCTLLGAVHFELGDDAAALEWYKKAETLGAVRAAIDQDLRALLFRVSPQQRQRIGGFLLAEDPERFIWVSVSMSVA